MNAKLLLPFLLLAPIACQSSKTVEPAEPTRKLYYDTPCIKAEWDAEKATFSYGPEEWSKISPIGFYAGECGNGSQDLLVIPVIIKDKQENQITSYCIATCSQADLLYVNHTRLKYPLFYHRGILEGDMEPMSNATLLGEYAVLKTDKKSPLVLVDDKAYPYTRYELRPQKSSNDFWFPHGIFQRQSGRATEFDGICIAKCYMSNDLGAVFSITTIEQASPSAIPVLTHYQGLQRKGNVLCDASGKSIFTITNSDGCKTLTDAQGRAYSEQERHFKQLPERASYAP
jgi:hypothetical protein